MLITVLIFVLRFHVTIKAPHNFQEIKAIILQVYLFFDICTQYSLGFVHNKKG